MVVDLGASWFGFMALLGVLLKIFFLKMPMKKMNGKNTSERLLKNVPTLSAFLKVPRKLDWLNPLTQGFSTFLIPRPPIVHNNI